MQIERGSGFVLLLEHLMGTFTRKTSRFLGIVALFFFSAVNARAQRVRGELRLEVHDPHGAAVSPAGELISEANGIRRAFVAGPEGRTLRRIFHLVFTG